MAPSPVNILFVSLRNTARSSLAQACLERFGHARFRAFSCGAPGHVGHAPEPAALAALSRAGIPSVQKECRDWNTFARSGAPMHYVITLAENLPGTPPAWPGQPVTAIWPFDDVVAASDSPDVLDKAMWTTLLLLRRRIELLVSLPMQTAGRSALRDDIRDMAQMR